MAEEGISLRCSDLDRSLECPGSITLNRIVTPYDFGEGDEGTALHALSSNRIITELGATGKLVKPTPAQEKLVRVSKWISNYYVRHVAENVPAEWSLEVEMALAYGFDGFILSGHIDCCAISPDATEAIGWDLKSGYDPVDEAEQNWQMLGYIVLLLCAYPSLRKVTFYVVQPRNDEEAGVQRVSSVTVTMLDEVALGLVSRIHSALRRPFELNSGRKQCRFCAAKLQCPAYQADRDLMKMTMSAGQLKRIQAEPDDATIADWVIAGKSLASGFEMAEELAKARIGVGHITASDGSVITLKTSPGSYSVTDPVGLWKAVAELIPDEERRAQCARFSVTALKDAIAEVHGVAKTGKYGLNATNIFAMKCSEFLEQGKREQLVVA